MNIDIDRLWMEEKRGTLTLPIRVTGSWKLSARVWVATRFVLIAAWLLSMGVEVVDKENV